MFAFNFSMVYAYVHASHSYRGYFTPELAALWSLALHFTVLLRLLLCNACGIHMVQNFIMHMHDGYTAETTAEHDVS